MSGWHGLRQFRVPGAQRRRDVKSRFDAIGKGSLATAIVCEQAVGAGARQEIQEADIVIAGKRDDPLSALRVIARKSSTPLESGPRST